MWENRLRLAESRALPYWREYARNEDFYAGKQLGSGDWMDDLVVEELAGMFGGGRILIVNRILAALASTNAAILWRIPHFYLWSRRPGGLAAEHSKMAAESSLNYLLQNPRNNFLQKSRLMLLETEMALGYMKVTYTPDEGEQPETTQEELGEIVIEQTPDGGVFVEFIGGQPKLGKDGLPIRRGDKFVVDNRNPADWFRSEWVHWSDMRHDPEGGNDLADHLWVAQRRSWTLNEYLENDLFGMKDEVARVAVFIDKEGLSRKTRSRLSAKESLGSIQGVDPTEYDRDLMRIWGYQCWNIKERQVEYIVDGMEKSVAKVAYPDYIDVSPYSVSKIHEVPGDFFPISEITAVRPLAQAYNEMQSMLLTHARRYGRKYLMRKGALSPREREKFKDPDDGVVIELERGDPSTAVAPVKDAPLDVAIYRNIERYINDFSEIMGSSPEARQVADSDTATQAAIIERHSTTRDNDKRSIVKAALEHHAKIMLDCLQKNLDIPMSIQMTGPDGAVFSSRKLSRAQIQGDFDVQISLGELEPHDVRSEKQDSLALLQILGPQIAFQSPTFTKRFFEVWRWNDPQMAQEFQAIATQMAQAALQPPAAGQGGPDQGGGPKPVAQGPDAGNTSEGRSQGRTLRGHPSQIQKPEAA